MLDQLGSALFALVLSGFLILALHLEQMVAP